MAASLGVIALGDGDSRHIADQAVQQWHAVMAALSRIIGNHGVSALYRRAMFLAQQTYPWLQPPAETEGMDLELLHGLLARREPAEALQASAALLRLFRDVLTSLIGVSLVERLLPAGLPHSPPGAAAQDPQT